MLVRLVNTSISAGWLILAVMALRLLLRRAPRSMVCALWAVAALRLVCPFSLHSPLSLIPSPETIPVSALTEDRTGEEPIRVEVVTNPAFPALTAPAPAGLTPAQVRLLDRYGTAVWAAGAGLMGAYALIGYLRLRRRVAASVRVKGDIWLCDGIDGPFLLGLIAPKIYIPSAMDREQLAYVIAHEQAHLKRRDHWWKVLGFGLLAVYWFHPLVWAAYALLCRDIELACDERVIRDMGRGERKTYSEILLSCSAAPSMAAVGPLTFGEVGVKRRVQSVLRYRRPTLLAVSAAGAAGLVLAACFLTDPPEVPAPEEAAAPGEKIVHYVSGNDIVGQAIPADEGALPGLICYDGQLYAETSVNSLGHIMDYGAALGRLTLAADTAQAPARDLETNEPSLAGAEAVPFRWGGAGDMGLCVTLSDRMEFYTLWEPGKAARLAAVLESEESFFTALMDEMMADGYRAMFYADYEKQYGEPPVSLAAVPAGFQDSGYVFLRQDPGGSDWTMTARLLYSFAQQAAITVIRYDDSEYLGGPSFWYGDSNEMGVPLGDDNWYAYRADYRGAVDGTEVALTLRSAQDLGEGYCRQVLVPGE